MPSGLIVTLMTQNKPLRVMYAHVHTCILYEMLVRLAAN